MRPPRQKMRRKCDPFTRKCTPDPRVENATPSSENAHLTRAGRQKCNPFDRKCVENATPSSINALRPPSFNGQVHWQRPPPVRHQCGTRRRRTRSRAEKLPEAHCVVTAAALPASAVGGAPPPPPPTASSRRGWAHHAGPAREPRVVALGQVLSSSPSANRTLPRWPLRGRVAERGEGAPPGGPASRGCSLAEPWTCSEKHSRAEAEVQMRLKPRATAEVQPRSACRRRGAALVVVPTWPRQEEPWDLRRPDARRGRAWAEPSMRHRDAVRSRSGSRSPASLKSSRT